MTREIAQVTAYYPPHVGGMENCVKEISEMLSERGYFIEVITSNIGSTALKEKVSNSLIVNRLRSIEFAHTAIIFSLFFKLLSMKKPTLIHLHVAQAYLPEIVYLVSIIRNVPYIAHIHIDADPSGKYGFLLEPYKKIFLSHVLKGAIKIICLSESQKKVIMSRYGINNAKIVALANGVDDSFFTNRTIAKKELPTILFVGRLATQKNIPLLLRAMASIKNKAKLRIVGDGEERQSLEQMVKTLSLKDVVFVGAKVGRDLIEEYQKADIFVLSSEKEGGAPLVLLEAIASGLPAIVTNIYGIKELLGDAVLLVDKADPHTMAKTIDHLITDLELQKTLSTKAKNKAKEFTWNKSIDRLEEIYNNILT